MDLPPSELLPLPGGPARVEWRRSPRARRVSLRIRPHDGAIIVTLPPRAGRPAGLALLRTHAAWVSDRLAALPSAVPFEDGASVPVGGVGHLIRHVPGGRGGAWFEAGAIHVAGAPEFLRRRVHDLLRAEARRRLSALAAEKAALGGLQARRVTVKDTVSRWGSCSADGSLAFSWRLVMAPPFVQDYVAAHEVAHLRHMNHGPRFWALVRTLTPHMDAAVSWLHEEGQSLMRIG
ncbi:MAG: M48 family metallopeptidase [Acetobacteraceae bacterium]|nr:M48 family metallopeptidase [Acetobacteraceae bacterium]